MIRRPRPEREAVLLQLGAGSAAFRFAGAFRFLTVFAFFAMTRPVCGLTGFPLKKHPWEVLYFEIRKRSVNDAPRGKTYFGNNFEMSLK